MPTLVMTVFDLLLKHSATVLMIFVGILILSIASLSMSVSTVSYALLMSWNMTQSSFLFALASSRVVLIILIGSLVLLPGVAAQLCSDRMGCSVKTLVILLVNIFVKI